MNRYFKAQIVPMVKKLKWIPVVDYLLRARRNKILKNEQKIIVDLLSGAEKIYTSCKEKPVIGIAHYGDDVFVNPINDNKLRYENYCIYNHFDYEMVNLSREDWQNEISRYDIIVWAVSSNPARLDEARQKIYFIEKYCNKMCFPSFDSVFVYENKVLQYELFKREKLPAVPTFISCNRAEALSYIEKCEYPLVSKIQTGSGSRGVEMIRNYKLARRFVNQVFTSGRSTYHTYLKQKDYVYFQKFITDSQYDLRIIIIGDRVFGYYRMKPSRDFRASGAGVVVKKELPESAMRLALKCKAKMNALQIAVDMITDSKNDNFMIIEASFFFGVETAEQLHVNGVPGFYEYKNDCFTFKEGRFWVQELAMDEVVTIWSNSEGQDTEKV